MSRSDLPSQSNQNKSAQTRWTSTKPRSTEYHHSKGRYLRAMEDPTLDDVSIASYQPPPLYFNAHSDFLHMTTPMNQQFIDDAKENRLSYLASIPIDDFNEQEDLDQSDDEQQSFKQRRRSKPGQNVRFNLPSSSLPKRKMTPSGQIKSKQQFLGNDFLKGFPLLRSLVEEALALQHSQDNVSISLAQMVFDDRPHSANQLDRRKSKPSPPRPQTATNIRSIRTKSVIIPRKRNDNIRRLYPPPPDTRHMVVTKNEVRNLVDRLSKPKFNKRIEREIAAVEHNLIQPEPNLTPRLPAKSVVEQVIVLFSNIFSDTFSFFYSFRYQIRVEVSLHTNLHFLTA